MPHLLLFKKNMDAHRHEEREWERERGRCTLIAKEKNVTMSSINAVCLSSVEFTWEVGKTGAVLVLFLRGVPFYSSDWASDGEQKQKQFVETTELAQPTAPDRFLVILFGPQRLIHILKNCRIRQTMNRGIEIWRCQMEYNKQAQAVQTLLSHA